MFEKLQEKLAIGKHVLKNRMVYSPTASSTASSAGDVTQKTLDYYDNLSRGGASLVYVGAVNMGPRKMNQFINMLCLHADQYIGGMADLAEVIHRNGALAGVQVMHLGRQGIDDVVGFSDVPSPLTNLPVRVLSESEIEEYEDCMSRAACRGKLAGFDLVDLHFSHGYLGGSSLSPHTNRRNDRYGGSFAKRMTFALNVIRKTRKLVGEDFPLTCRISSTEMIDGGMTIQDSVRICKQFEQEGIAAINLSAGVHEVFYYTIPPYQIPRGYNVKNASEFTKELGIPVGVAGRINDPKLANHVIESGQADYVLLSRGLIADPEFPKKVLEGHEDRIRRCVACNQCLREEFSGRSLKCQVNPLVGRERYYANRDVAERKKKVVVVGAGPAGMEATRAAAMRGHDVTLIEKEGELISPQFRSLLKTKVNREFSTLLAFYRVEFNRLKNVKLVLQTVADRDEIVKRNPDVVIVATGATQSVPEDIPEDNGRILAYGCERFIERFEKGELSNIGHFSVIGEDIIACDVADYLGRKNCNVDVIAKTPVFPFDVEPLSSFYLARQFGARKNVTIRTNAVLEGFDGETIRLFDVADRKRFDLKTGCVVFSNRRKSSNSLVHELSGAVRDLHVIGDAKEPRMIIDAIREGFVTAMDL